MFPVLQIWYAWPYVLWVSVVWCNIEALQKSRFKMIMKCLKKVKIFEWPVLPYSFSPVACGAMNPDHKYLDNQTGDRLVKVMKFLTDLNVYIYVCSMS